MGSLSAGCLDIQKQQEQPTELAHMEMSSQDGLS